MMHHPCSTYLGQNQCGLRICIIFWFSWYKNLYVLYFQIYTYYKRTLMDSDLVLARWDLEDVFDRLWVFKRESKSQTILYFMLYVSFMNKTLIIITLCLLVLWVTAPHLLNHIVFIYLLIYIYLLSYLMFPH